MVDTAQTFAIDEINLPQPMIRQKLNVQDQHNDKKKIIMLYVRVNHKNINQREVFIEPWM